MVVIEARDPRPSGSPDELLPQARPVSTEPRAERRRGGEGRVGYVVPP